MLDFSYKAIDRAGKTLSGVVEAVDQAAALEKISRLGLTPVKLTEGGSVEAWWSRDIKLFGSVDRFKSKDIEALFSTLATMTQAQLPLPRTLRLATDMVQTQSFKRHLKRAQQRLDDGKSLAACLEDSQGRFPERLLRLIELGERSNSLPEVSVRVSNMLTCERELKSELRQALVYPIILLLMSLVVVSILIFYLTPTLLPVFVSSGAEPPFVIKAMGWFRSSVIQYWWAISFIFLGTFLTTFAFTGIRRRIVGWAILTLPGFGPYFKDRDFLAFCNSLDLMQASGASVLEGVKTAGNSVTSPAWKELSSQLYEGIQSGQALSNLLGASSLPDPTLVSMISAGEEGNRLPEVLPVVCKALERRARGRLSAAVKLITPVLTLIIGVSVGGVILSTIGAILDLNDALY